MIKIRKNTTIVQKNIIERELLISIQVSINLLYLFEEMFLKLFGQEMGLLAAAILVY